MKRGGPVALALGLAFASCSVYEPSLLTGDGIEGSPASARGGNAGKAGAGQGGVAQGGTSASGRGAVGGEGSIGGSSALAGATYAGDAGEAGEGAGGEGSDGAGGSGGDGAGSGGRAGASGGSAGSGAVGGEASRGGSAGTGTAGGGAGGNAGSVGGGAGAGAGGSGANESCSGCARLSVPLATATDQAHFLMTLPSNTDFSNAVVTFRVRCEAGSGGQLRGYLQHGGTPDYAFLVLGITELADLSGWTSVSYELSGVTGFDKTVVRRVGLEITAAGSSSWLNPTVVYLDSISIANTVLNPSSFSFDAADSITATPSSLGPADQSLWLNDAEHDSNVAATLSWLGP